ncbi:hypothetical protein SBOR_6366 [Sclerotinia borealis F-4128]|uniref:Uncharacterized protein n=1 Tax=Sclerotinia borealis (strain F-4128) TaxID=1432307 RepID=W9CBP4_SCLBF|nr:hypothetical protein SBOR_6366 [Sclerotinia borealis F-4128]
MVKNLTILMLVSRDFIHVTVEKADVGKYTQYKNADSSISYNITTTYKSPFNQPSTPSNLCFTAVPNHTGPDPFNNGHEIPVLQIDIVARTKQKYTIRIQLQCLNESDQVKKLKNNSNVKDYYKYKESYRLLGENKDVKDFLKARNAKANDKNDERSKKIVERLGDTADVVAYLKPYDKVGKLAGDKDFKAYRGAEQVRKLMMASEEVLEWKRALAAAKVIKEAGFKPVTLPVRGARNTTTGGIGSSGNKKIESDSDSDVGVFKMDKLPKKTKTLERPTAEKTDGKGKTGRKEESGQSTKTHKETAGDKSGSTSTPPSQGKGEVPHRRSRSRDIKRTAP